MTKLARSIAIMLLCGLYGCTTQKAMTDFASVTAANVAVVNTSLARFAEDSESLSKDRARAMQHLSNQLDRAERQLAEDLIVLERRRATGDYDALVKLRRESESVRLGDRQKQSTALLEEMLAARSELSVPGKELRSVAKTLSSLGEVRDTKNRVRFFASFANQVVDDIELASELQREANASAQNKVRNTMSPTDDQ